MPASELQEWARYEELEGPIVPHERLDWVAAQICSVLANVNGDGKRRYTPRDFLAQWSRPSKQELADRLMGMVQAVGVREDRRDG